jgi:hypothetical protein
VKPRFSNLTTILICILLAGAGLGLWGCGTSSAEEGMTNQEAADIVREYFATTAADRMQGVTIEDLQVVTAKGQQTLRLDLVSDGSDAADMSLAWLCFGATSEESWPGDLNRDWGVSLLWVDTYTTYPWGITEHTLVDVAGHGLTTEGGAPHWRGGPATTAPAGGE